MVWTCTHIPTIISTGVYKDDTIETYSCKYCNSEQEFYENGRTADYSFTIGQYKLYFCPPSHTFQILPAKSRMGDKPKPYLQLGYLPLNLTPKTCTEDRIKLLILFS